MPRLRLPSVKQKEETAVVCPQCGTLNANERGDCQRCKKPLHPPFMQGKIACVVHANREATTGCASCGKRLCADCAANANGIDYCDDCAPANAVRHDYEEDYERVPVVNPAKAAKAGFGTRLFAFVLDAGVVFGLGIVVALVAWMSSGSLNFLLSPRDGRVGWWLYWGFLFLVTVAYQSVMVAMNGQTLGKQVAGVIVLEPEGHVITLRQSIIRACAALLSALPLGLGFWWALWDKNGQTWHDKIAQTRTFRWEKVA